MRKQDNKEYIYGAILFAIILAACLALTRPVIAKGLDGGGDYPGRGTGGPKRRTPAGA